MYSPGFMGYIESGSTKYRCTSFSVNIKQEALFYDHIIGLRDSIPDAINVFKGDGGDKSGSYNTQRIFMRPGPAIVEGGFSFMWEESTAWGWISQAMGGEFFDISCQYDTGLKVAYSNCMVNTYTFKASAGEPVTSTIDIMGMGVSNTATTACSDAINTTSKIITWDNVKVSNVKGSDIVSFEFTINNGVIPIYTAGSTYPSDLRAGMQTLTGSVSTYDSDFSKDISSRSTISVTVNDTTYNLSVLFLPSTQGTAIGPVIRTIPFVGIDHNISTP